jgi:hypothetical protein
MVVMRGAEQVPRHVLERRSGAPALASFAFLQIRRELV